MSRKFSHMSTVTVTVLLMFVTCVARSSDEAEKDSVKNLIEGFGFLPFSQSELPQGELRDDGKIKGKMYGCRLSVSDAVFQIGYEYFSSEGEASKNFENRQKFVSAGLQSSAPFQIGNEIYFVKYASQWTFCVRLKRVVFWYAGESSLFPESQVKKVLLALETEFQNMQSIKSP